MTGIGGASRPLPERGQERPRLSHRPSPAPPQVRCLSCRRAGAACSFARAASTCNYNGLFGDFFDQPKVADAVWDLFRDVFGIQKTSVRVVIGVASLPLGGADRTRCHLRSRRVAIFSATFRCLPTSKRANGHTHVQSKGVTTMGRLTDKNILITGGNSGIGLAAAQEFDREGARVAICGLNEGALQAAKEALGPRRLAGRADVRNLPDLDT